MILTKDMYVPSLRWRQGEYQALFRLADTVKARIVPFVTIPPVEFDFELWQPKKTVHEHVKPFSRRFRDKWNKRPAWIGVHKSIIDKPMDDGRAVFSYVFDELREFEACAVPSVSVEADKATLHVVAAIAEVDKLGVAISLRLEDLMKPDSGKLVRSMALELGVPINDIDLVIDLGAPNFLPYEVFANALISVLGSLSDLEKFRNLIVVGTAIPESFKDIARGADQIPRHDWLFYQVLLAKLPPDMRRPNFGDYTIVHPDFTPIDMRKIKSAGKVVYTTPQNWEVRKGGAFRDNPKQMHGHCEAIVSSGKFMGAWYSSGDDYIAKCAARTEGPSNQTRWKDVAINHHITHVVDDLATLAAAP